MFVVFFISPEIRPKRNADIAQELFHSAAVWRLYDETISSEVIIIFFFFFTKEKTLPAAFLVIKYTFYIN